MDTRKLDPLNQLDRLANRVGPRLSAWLDRLEARHRAAFLFRRAVGRLALPAFLAFVLWMVGAMLGLWPEGYSVYTWFAVKAWILGIMACVLMLWGLRDR